MEDSRRVSARRPEDRSGDPLGDGRGRPRRTRDGRDPGDREPGDRVQGDRESRDREQAVRAPGRDARGQDREDRDRDRDREEGSRAEGREPRGTARREGRRRDPRRADPDDRRAGGSRDAEGDRSPRRPRGGASVRDRAPGREAAERLDRLARPTPPPVDDDEPGDPDRPGRSPRSRTATEPARRPARPGARSSGGRRPGDDRPRAGAAAARTSGGQTSGGQTSGGRTSGGRTSRGPRTPAPPPEPVRRRRGRIALVVASVLVFVLGGTGWAALAGGVATSASALGSLGGAADGATDILLVGTDSRTDAQGRALPPDVLASLGASDENGVLNTDTMILVRVPNDGSRAVAFSIPRDSYVPIPGGGRRDKINSAYPGAKSQAADQLVASGDTDARDVDLRSSEAGRQALVAAVQTLTGLTVDHYAEINLLGFFTLTQAVGGVDVCLKNPVDDEKSGARFPAGPRTVAGHDALAFVRQRYGLPNGDLDRVRRQQAFLASLSHKVLSAGTLTDPFTLARLLEAVKQSVVLDGDWDLLRFAQQMQGVTGGSVVFMTIPTQGTENTGQGDVLRVDPAEVQRFVRDAIGDESRPAPSGPSPATVPVDVRNASGTTGAAARVVSVLAAQGFTRTASGNADATAPAARSTVLVGPDADAGGALVAATLGGLPTRVDPTVPAGTVRVLLAADYAGPGSATADAAAAAAPPPPPPITAEGVACVD